MKLGGNQKVNLILVLGVILCVVVASFFDSDDGTKQLIIVNSNDYTSIRISEDDPRVSDIWHKGNVFVINNSSRKLRLRSVIYSKYSMGFSGSTISIIEGNSIYASADFISFKFKEPPESISVRETEEITKSFLHLDYDD